MISRAEALRHVLDRVPRLAPVDVAVVDAAGLVLAADAVAAAAVPPFANSAMDGVAVRAADTAPGATLRLVGTIAAGVAPEREVGDGEAMRIMTGAPMPPGADAVVMVEDCSFGHDGDGDVVTVVAAVDVGRHVRPVGDDIRPGDVVLGAGRLVTPGGVAVLRTMGLEHVRVFPRPRVGVLSTGDELVEPPAALGPGQIYESNRIALLAAVAGSGFEPVDLGLVRDDEAAIEDAFREGVASCDAVLSSGGVSMGDFDYVKVVLDRIGDLRWMQIAIRPAKPFAFGTLDDDGRRVPLFGLPGNPVSSLVSYELMARPGLRAMAGHDRPEPAPIAALAGEDFRRRPDGRTHYVRVVLDVSADGTRTARSAGGQGSHHAGAMAIADGLAVLEDGDGVGAGDALAVLPLGPWP